jgi:hypothetical protein
MPWCSVASKGGSGIFCQEAKNLPVPPREERGAFDPPCAAMPSGWCRGEERPSQIDAKTPAAGVEQGTWLR